MSERDDDGLPAELPENPLQQAKVWLDAAMDKRVQRNPNSMTIATVGADGQPSARVVLCKSFVSDPGYVVFHTNYQSRKGQELAQNPLAAALIHWDALGKQIRIEGIVVQCPQQESDDYFATRGWGSQLGAWGSDQSAEIGSKEELVRQIRERGETLGLQFSGPGTGALEAEQNPTIERPPHWGGYRLWASSVELWVEGLDRIHDRARWRRTLERTGEHDYAPGPWTASRLQP